MELKRLQEAVASFRDERAWSKFHNPKDLAQAISIEAAELLELFLWKTVDEIESMMKVEELREKVEDEVADIFSFLLSFVDSNNIDLAAVLLRKIEKNNIKYPVDLVKGSAKKYDEY